MIGFLSDRQVIKVYPELRNKVVVVTGSAGGIGKEIAKLFSREGAIVCLLDKISTEKVAKEIELFGGKCKSYIVDIINEESVTDCFESIIREIGGIDILVNNAGVLIASEFLQTSLELWNKMLSLNLTSVFLCSKASIPSMVQRGGGCIINAASWAAKIPSIGHGGYGAAKAGVLNLTATLAGELARYGIRVVAYMPGVVRTPLSQGIVDKNPLAVANTIALGRIAEPIEIAKVVVFLASDTAAYIDGTTIEISGGKLCVQNPIPLGKEV